MIARWRATLTNLAQPRVRAMLLLGFGAGLPFPLVLTTLSARLRQSGIDRTTIGYFSLVGLAYSLKLFWSPIVDRMPLPLLNALGRRRSWMLFAQCGIAAGLVAMALVDPGQQAETIALCAVFTAFFSATQDIALDAYRIEAVGPEWQGAMAAAYQIGYSCALIVGGAGALYAAAKGGWTTAYLVMAACFAIAPLTTLFIREPDPAASRRAFEHETLVIKFLERSKGLPAFLRNSIAWFIGAVFCPIIDFFVRNGWRLAVPLLLLIVCYRLNYTTMGVAAIPFYVDLGYTLDSIALISKGYGVALTLGGAILAGYLVKRIGIPWTMLIGVVLLSCANLLYAYSADQLASFLAQHAADPKGSPEPALGWLTAMVSLDNVANGIAGTAFIAFMSSLTNVAYTATQYALFGTLWSLPAKGIASQWGVIVDKFGYAPFFVYTAATGVPAIAFVLWLLWHERRERAAAHDTA